VQRGDTTVKKKNTQAMVRIDADQHAALAKISADTGIPIAAIVRRAITDYLKKAKK
jgi:predicted HicB family RNase H-like nuclease